MIRECYCVYDLRHALEVRLFQATRDVYQEKKALEQSNVAVTERYLRSLGLERVTA